MKNFTLKIAFIVLLTFCAVFGAYTQELDDLQKGVAELSGTLAKSLPFNSSIGLNWSDAYIGKLLPSLPPHFGIGVTAGTTTFELSAIKALTDTFGVELEAPSIPFAGELLADKMILPAYTAEARVGGVFLPFDVGVKFGLLPNDIELGLPFNLDYMLAGADLRWALLDGKDNLFLPNISIGAGVNYVSGGIGATVNSNTSFTFKDGSNNDHTIAMSDTDFNLLWESKSIEGKVQISKQLLIFTPYLGAAAGYSWSKAGYDIKTSAAYDGQVINQADINDINDFLTDNDLDPMDITEDGISSIIEQQGWHARAFGGISFDLMVIRLDLSGMYNIFDGQLGAQVGLRVQL